MENSEDLYIGEYKQSRRNNCRGTALIEFIIISLIAVSIFILTLSIVRSFYDSQINHPPVISLPVNAILIKKYPDFYHMKRDENGNIYYEGMAEKTIYKLYIGNTKSSIKSKKEKPELSRKR
jgi:hypothetical protein